VYLKVLNINNNTNKVTNITIQAGVLERKGNAMEFAKASNKIVI